MRRITEQISGRYKAVTLSAPRDSRIFGIRWELSKIYGVKNYPDLFESGKIEGGLDRN